MSSAASGAVGPIHSARLLSRPSKGSVSIDGNQLVYTSNAGYVRDDHFTQGLNTRNQPITRTVVVNVKVWAQL
jgi:hypothetical protein